MSARARDNEFVKMISHLANFVTMNGTCTSDVELVLKFKTSKQALECESALKAAVIEMTGQALYDANESPHKDRFTFMGVSIKIAHTDARPYAPLSRKRLGLP